MRKSKTKWIPVFDGEGKHVRTDSIGTDRREHKSLGRSNDKPANVKVEMRAATLAMSWCKQGPADYVGWEMHRYGRDLDARSRVWAGWLEREISTHDEQQERLSKEREEAGCMPTDRQAEATAHFNALCDGPPVNVEALLADVTSAPPPAGWQAKVHAACDAVDEQTRHDVAASVARHDAMDPKTQLVIGLLGMSNPADPGHAKLCEQLCEMLPGETERHDYLRESIAPDGTATMVAVDQSDPHASFAAKFQTEHADDEPTQVATVVDERFDGSEP